jgi:hypothetical protein
MPLLTNLIYSFVSGSTLLVRTWPPHAGGFVINLDTHSLFRRLISPKGLYLHRTTQDRKSRKNIHALSGVRIHSLSVQAIKAFASDRAVTGTGTSHKSKPKLPHYTPWRRLEERKYSSYSFMISALYGDEWLASRHGRALPPGKDPRYPLHRMLGGPQNRSGHRG